MMILKNHINVHLLKWSNFHALKPYIPALSSMLREPKDSKDLQATSWVYGFKKNFKQSSDFKMILEAAAAHFCCDGILPIPPSDPVRQPNSLQRLFGTPILRTEAVETRKYNHHRFLPEHYSRTYEVTPPDGSRFLLVDDVLRTGATMNHFRVTLAGMGLETVPLALGIYYRLPYLEGDSISIFVQKTEVDQVLDEMILEI
jgi:predicted amidophosphoribosyltransferase